MILLMFHNNFAVPQQQTSEPVLHPFLLIKPFLILLACALTSVTLLAPACLAEQQAAGVGQSQNDQTQTEALKVRIAEPFIELHTGSGVGYPVFHVVEKEGLVTIVKKRTDWYKLRTEKAIEGWAHQSQLLKTLNLDGSQFDVKLADEQDYRERRFGAGFMSGDFGGARVMTLHGNWSWTRNIEMELAYSQALGSASAIQMAELALLHQAFPDWLVSPYFRLGGGMVKTSPQTTLILSHDREDEMIFAGIGARVYLARQFSLRAEYNAYTILTSRNDNDEVEEWKIGFSVFF